MKKKMSTSVTNELGKHPCKEELNGVVGKNNNEKNKLVVGLWKTSQNYEVTTGTNGNNCLLEINEEMKTAFAERIGENLYH